MGRGCFRGKKKRRPVQLGGKELQKASGGRKKLGKSKISRGK